MRGDLNLYTGVITLVRSMLIFLANNKVCITYLQLSNNMESAGKGNKPYYLSRKIQSPTHRPYYLSLAN